MNMFENHNPQVSRGRRGMNMSNRRPDRSMQPEYDPVRETTLVFIPEGISFHVITPFDTGEASYQLAHGPCIVGVPEGMTVGFHRNEMTYWVSDFRPRPGHDKGVCVRWPGNNKRTLQNAHTTVDVDGLGTIIYRGKPIQNTE